MKVHSWNWSLTFDDPDHCTPIWPTSTHSNITVRAGKRRKDDILSNDQNKIKDPKRKKKVKDDWLTIPHQTSTHRRFGRLFEYLVKAFTDTMKRYVHADTSINQISTLCELCRWKFVYLFNVRFNLTNYSLSSNNTIITRIFFSTCVSEAKRWPKYR